MQLMGLSVLQRLMYHIGAYELPARVVKMPTHVADVSCIFLSTLKFYFTPVL